MGEGHTLPGIAPCEICVIDLQAMCSFVCTECGQLNGSFPFSGSASTKSCVFVMHSMIGEYNVGFPLPGSTSMKSCFDFD